MAKSGPQLSGKCTRLINRRALRIVLWAGLLQPFCMLTARTVVLTGIDFHQLDLNRDGYIDRREAGSRPEFSMLLKSGDTDRDGRLSENEFHAAQKALRQGRS
jgi:hypothetical protein